LDAELSKELKKTPVVEYQVPKTILVAEDNGRGGLGSLLQNVFEES
jgi:U3 small nucleolar RNA-associated protein 19